MLKTKKGIVKKALKFMKGEKENKKETKLEGGKEEPIFSKYTNLKKK